MSSATSTDVRPNEVRPKPDAGGRDTGGGRHAAGRSGGSPGRHPVGAGEVQGEPRAQGLQPWQFFVLAGLGCATVAMWVVRGQGALPVILLSVIIGCASLVGFAALWALRPLVTSQQDRTPMFGHRTRMALEREKMLALRSIKELEFDRAMGKLSEADWLEMSGRLRARATRLMRQLDAGAGYRDQIEHELAKRIGAASAPGEAAYTCSSCRTVNDPDARFCKSCGQKL